VGPIPGAVRNSAGLLWRLAVGAGIAPVAAGFVARLSAERDRWLLWVPVAIALGVYGYFALPVEPAWSIGAGAVAGLTVLFLCLRSRPAARFPVLLSLMAAVGFSAATVRTLVVDAPVIARKVGPVSLTGRVLSVEPRQHGARVILDRLTIDRVARPDTPDRVRLTVRVGWALLRPGQIINTRAILLPVRPPVSPGAMDFQRRAYFQRIGASGFVLTAPDVLETPALGWFGGIIEQVRDRVARRITAALPGKAGAVANALLTGHRGAISPETMEAIRTAGLAHLLAISGLHIGMVGGLAFFALWLGLELIPGVALRRPTRKIAAVGALIVALGYLLLTGATIPTQRAFMMLAIVMLGVLIGRVAISMRLVAVAASVILLLTPESLLTPSFQMSFAAVVALVAVYEAWSRARSRSGAPPRFNRPVRGLIGIGATSLIAGAATAPFAVYHFQRLAMFGLAANLVVVPIVSFFVLPLGIIAILVMPLGLEQAPLWLMAQGIHLMLWVATNISALPGALALSPSPAAWGMALIVAGGLWFAIWQGRWRYAGTALILAGLSSTLFLTRPDILISPTGKLAATRTADGALAVSSARRGRFITRVWLEGEAQRQRRFWRKDRLSRVRCDALGCVYRLKDGQGGKLIAFPSDPAALAEDCGKVFMIVAAFDARKRCRATRWIIDRPVLNARGSHAVRIAGDRVILRTDRDVRGDRPWVNRPPLRVRRVKLARKR